MTHTQKGFFSARRLVVMAVLAAIQIVLSRYLAIHVSDTLRISFETVPLALAGLWLGPAAGAVVAFVSDILGTIIYGYGVYFPPIALGPVLFAVLCGLCRKRLVGGDPSQRGSGWKIIGVVAVAGAINAFGIGLVTTTWYQMIVVGKEGTFAVLALANLMSRLTTKPVTIVACAILTWLLHRAVYRRLLLLFQP